MATKASRIIDWIRYSGAGIILHLNPLHWRLLPWFRNETNWEWPSPQERTWALGWLCITVRIWIDDGSW